MPLHPQARDFLATVASDEGAGHDARTLEDIRRARAAPDPFVLHRGPLTTLPFVRDELAEAVPIRVYRADPGDGPLPVVVYFHGGGFVGGSVKRSDAMGRFLAVRTGAVVVSAGYRLAPEHPFPAAADDAWTVVRDIFARPAFYQSNGVVAVAGESAGGNLAAVAAWQARDAGLRLAHQALACPLLDAAMELPSHRDYAKGYALSAAELAWSLRCYAGGADPADPRLSPLRLPDVAGLPPATVVTAEYDVLRDEGEAYARRLAEAGVPAECRRWDGALHGFTALPGLFDQGAEARDYLAARLRQAL
ncbi:Carboxylesterase NlhH [Nonomuraea coxensis DSM 45129]|uniref:Carboxylesterase NlhH n=1 Tax=Nonomuraea coxensis DSM 45129 TaxID=1122611 RepID=A0ABX8U2M0_9ACTN|nr:alpha/beta hydrolase [Nonomuraea coxensis]QYC41379.1 Carboxylesterase NlhH [Nonomuraea coxensis DSM 45129]